MASLCLGLNAQTDENSFSAKWSHSIDAKTTVGESPIALALSSDGKLFQLMSFATSSSKGTEVYFDGTPLALGDTPVEGAAETSNTNNILFQKVDKATGVADWFIYSASGDAETANCHVAPSSDGGAYLLLKTRSAVAADPSEVFVTLVDAAGAIVEVKDPAYKLVTKVTTNTTNNTEVTTKFKFYHYALVRIDSKGAIKWAKPLTADPIKTTDGSEIPSGDSFDVEENGLEAVTNGLYFYSLVTDDAGNLYAAGRMLTRVHVGSDAIAPANFKNGDPFILKFSADGELLADKTVGVADDDCYCYFDKLAFDGGKLYVVGHAKASDGLATLSFDGKNFVPSTSVDDVLISAVATSDLSADYVHLIKGSILEGDVTDVKIAFNAYVSDGGLYVFSQKRCTLTDGDVVLRGKAQYDAFFMKCDLATGAMVAGSSCGDAGISAYSGMMPYNGMLYLFAYNQTDGAVLDAYDAETFSFVKRYVVGKSGGITSLIANPVADGDDLFLLYRAKGDVKVYNSDGEEAQTIEGNTDWLVVASGYTFSHAAEVPTALEASSLADGAEANFDVYTLGGVLVRKAANLQEAKAGLQRGLYVIGGRMVVVR